MHTWLSGLNSFSLRNNSGYTKYLTTGLFTEERLIIKKVSVLSLDKSIVMIICGI